MAGSSVTMAIRPTAIPMAATGPSPADVVGFGREQADMPATTVSPLAMMAGPARRRATAMAWCRLSCLRSSSRYLAMSNSA